MGAFIALCLFLSPALASPQIDCFMDNEECDITADNLINTYPGVATPDECKLLCEDNGVCIAFTHFGEDSPPFHNDCLLFSSCIERRPCTNCSTGSSQTECVCSIGYSGIEDENNLVDLIASVADEHECKKHCVANDLCKVYTYFDSRDPTTPELCFLLTSTGLQSPVTLCDNCKTGPASCNIDERCQAAVLTDGFHTQFFFHTSRDGIGLNLIAAEKNCYVDLNIVAIGGGGEYASGSFTGGGSGYLEQAIVRLNTSSILIAFAGGSGKQSSVRINGEYVLQGAPGSYSNASSGGDGYCGGGGGIRNSTWGGQGGVDGGDGEDGPDMNNSPGGKGSGLDLATFPMKHFNLQPGAGGQNGGENGGHGGGGGGVIVNGQQPGSNQYRGQGYGGGGAYISSTETYGYKGCVLIEL